MAFSAVHTKPEREEGKDREAKGRRGRRKREKGGEKEKGGEGEEREEREAGTGSSVDALSLYPKSTLRERGRERRGLRPSLMTRIESNWRSGTVWPVTSNLKGSVRSSLRSFRRYPKKNNART